MALFEDLALGLLTKYNNFLGVCSILVNKLSDTTSQQNFDDFSQKLWRSEVLLLDRRVGKVSLFKCGALKFGVYEILAKVFKTS